MITPHGSEQSLLSPEEQETVNRYRAMVARELEQYCADSELMSIKLMLKLELIMLHSNLGAAIRNEYELWMPEHEVTSIWRAAVDKFPIDVHACDEHPCHPDNFSFSCIELLWENLQ
jgi:hypothetical protein